MKFVPKTDDELASENLLPDGTYNFEVMEAEEKLSKGGNEMIRLKLKVYDGSGGFKYVDDYLLEAILYKVKHCMDACGLSAEYARGELDAKDMIGRSGQVKIISQQDKEKNYPPRNAVKDYVIGKGAAAPQKERKTAMASSGATDPFDDEIPF